MLERAELNPWDVMEDRAPRSSETRDFEQRPAAWRPASQLPDPDPRDGWVHRWVMVTTLGQEYATHFSQMRREGWQPCHPQDYPEMALEIVREDNIYAQKGLIEIGGLVLCRLPVEGAQARHDFYTRRNKEAVQSPMNELLGHQHRETNMGTFVEHNRSRVSFGSGARNAGS